MNAFITGISGFAGTHLAEHLLDCGDQVVGCSRRGQWSAETPAVVKDNVFLLSWDVREKASGELESHIRRFAPDCVYHLAAISVPGACGEIEPTEDAYTCNVLGTQCVIDFVQRLPSRPRILLTSSCHVYAPAAATDWVVMEDAPLGPTSGYGKTKLAAEQRLLAAFDGSAPDAVIARVFQHTGPRQRPPMMLPEWAVQLVRGDDPIRVLTLDATLDITDVRDVVRAYRGLAINAQPGGIYNIGSGIARRTGDLFESLRMKHDPSRGVMETAPGPRQNPIADIARLISCTKWQANVTLDQTLQDILDFWKTRSIV